MRILVRHYNNEHYVWKDAVYEGGSYYVTDSEGKHGVPETDIAMVDGHETNHVICRNCGQSILNTPEEIEKHFTEKEAEKDCSKCYSLRIVDREKLKRAIKLKENGKYAVVEEYESALNCGRSYYSRPISDPRVKDTCPHHQCRRLGVTEPNNVLYRYPDAFETLVTADALVAKKHKYLSYNSYDECYEYDMKARGTLTACVNSHGVVDYFKLIYSRNRAYFYYSEKYDKLFFQDGSWYNETKPYWLSDTKYEEIHKKIKALYEGANK